MDKKAYLKELEAALLENYPEKQVQDILADYGNFFEDGIAEGKSEETLCREFGPPEQAVRELKGENSTQPSAGRIAAHSGMISFLLGALILTVFFFVVAINLRCGQYIHYSAVFLLPLAIQGIISFQFSCSTESKANFRWIPFCQIIFFVFLVTAAGASIYEILFIDRWAALINEQGGSFYWALAQIVTWGITLAVPISVLSGILWILYGAHERPKTRWFVFLNSFTLVLFLNFRKELSFIHSPYNGAESVVDSILYALFPTLAAAAVFLIVMKIHAKRRQKNGRSDEKRRSRNVHPA